MLIASVILAEAAISFDKIYDYIVPSRIFAKEGCRVMVPFGKGKDLRQGFILRLKEGDGKRLKEISYCLDKEPLLNNEGLYLVSYLHDTVFCRWFEGVKCQIPPGAGMKISFGLIAKKGLDTECLDDEEKRIYEFICKKKSAVSEKTLIEVFGFGEDNPSLKGLLEKEYICRNQMVRKNILDKKAVMARVIDYEPKKLSKKQKEVFELLGEIGTASVKELCYFCGVTIGVVKTMAKNGVVELYEEIITPIPKPVDQKEKRKITLSNEQQKAFEGIKQKLGKFNINLLFGVTGSGKTSVFLRLIEEVQKMGKEALVLIPEISLTPQTSAKFKEIFGEKVAVLNSTLSMTERMEQYELIKSGKCPIVVGTRLSVFSPLENIGLIVIDEEQEHTYHSEMSPRFHARQIAVARAKYHNAPLLLCSATPSVESFYYAKTGKYGLFKLTERYSKNDIPPIETIDMIGSTMCGDSALITQRLAEEISYNLHHNEQTVLLLNRRGYTTKLCCVSCRQVTKCPHCSVAMTYHSANGRLICHSCGYQTSEPQKCPTCGGEILRYKGEGTQKAQEELQRLFPKARILRMDADSTMTKNSHKDGFEAFKDGNYDIMIGTQMVSKGLNFPFVTLVGVLNADLSLYSEDFRSFERTFSLITQTVGRAGRGKKPGRALIQTFSPDNSVLQFCKTGDYEAFFDEEIKFRKAGLYPPFCNVVSVVFKNQTENKAQSDSFAFSKMLKETAEESYKNVPLRLLGPAPAPTYKRSGSYYMQILLKCRADKKFCELLHKCCELYTKNKCSSLLTVDMFYD